MIHQEKYDVWKAKLSDNDYDAIIAELHKIMDEKDIINSSFIPGSDWTGKVYEPIYYACGENEDNAKLFYGLLVWEATQLHSENWMFIKTEDNPDKPSGTTYFKRKDKDS